MRCCVFAFFGIASALVGDSRSDTNGAVVVDGVGSVDVAAGARGGIRPTDPVLSAGRGPVVLGGGEGRAPTRDHRCDGQSSESRSRRYDPLVCWLWDLKVSIPDEEIKKSFFSVHINDMTCTNFEIGSIDSSHTKPKADPVERSDSPGPTISLSISGVSATCSGKYQVAGTSGSIKASVKSIENKPLRLAIGFVSGPLQGKVTVAKSANTTFCETNLRVPERDGLEFHGSVSASIIEMFAAPIAKHVSSALSSQLCPAIKSEMDPQLSAALRRADAYLSDLIQNYTAEVATQTRRRAGAPPDDTIDFERDTPLLNDFLLRANDFLSRHLDSGFVLDVLNRIGITDGAADCGDCGLFFKGVNGLTKYLTGGSGLIQMHIPQSFTTLRNATFSVPGAGVVRVDLREINATGLENLTNLTVFRPRGDRNFRSTLASADVNLTARLDIRVDPVEGGIFQGRSLRETFDIHVDVSDVDVMGNVVFGLSREEFSSLTVGDVLSFFNVDNTENVRQPNALNCLLSTLASVDFSDVRVHLDVAAIQILPYATTSSSHAVTNEQDLEYELDGLLNNFLAMFLGEYEILVTESVAALARGPLRSALNDFIKSAIGGTTGSKNDKGERLCASPLSGGPAFFRFDRSDAFKKFSGFIDRNLGISELNSYFTCVSAFIQKSWPSSGVIHNGTYGGIEVVLRDLVMHSNGNLTEFDVIKPEEDSFHLMNRFRFGECGTKNVSDCGDEVSSTSVTIEISRAGLHGEVNVTAKLGYISMEGGTMVLFDMNKFSSMKIIRLLSRLQCSAAPASAFQFYGFAGALGVTELNIDAAVKMEGRAPLSYSLKLGEEDAPHNAINSYLAWFSASVENIMNGVSRTALNQASYACTGESTPSKSSSKTTQERKDHSKTIFWYTFGIAIACIVANFALCLSRSCRETGNDDLKRDELSELLLGEQKMPRTEVVEGDSAQSSLMFHASTPIFFRHALPIILFSTMALFLSSNLSTGASVDLELSGAEGKSFQLPSIFAFSLGRTVAEMYGAHVYAIMLLVVVFSGIWPYLKLILMLFAWATPSSTLSVNKRENLLIWLDALGKFSLIDAYVLVLMMVAFRYHLDVPSMGSVDVYVTPMFGFYGFLLATIISLISGHVILLIHRQSTVGWAQEHVLRKESLRQHVYLDDVTGRAIRLSKKFQLFLLAALLLTVVLLALGVGTKSFHFEIGGLAGMALGENRSESYSLVSLGTSIPQSVEDPSYIGIRWIQLTYYFFALVMPFAFLAVIIVVFSCPMNLKVQRWAVVVAEIANAWSAVEVFLLSIVAALVEISTFSEFIIGDRCDFINDVLGRWFDKELHGDDKCFSVKATIKGDSWLLFCGVTLSSFLSFVLLRLAHRSMGERLNREAIPNDSAAEPGGDAIGKELELGPVPFAHGCLGKFLYEDVVGCHEVPSPRGGNADDFRSNRRESTTSFWEHWRDIASFA